MSDEILTDAKRHELIKDLELEKFARSVEEIAKNNDSLVYPNSTAKHAAIVLGNLFNKTQNEIYAYAEDLNGAVTNQKYCRYFFESMLKRPDIKVNYIIRKEPEPGKREILQLLLNRQKESKENTKIYIIEKHKEDKLDAFFQNGHYNFTISDNHRYRLETDVEKFIAEFSFNKRDFSNSLKTVFDILKEKFSTDYIPSENFSA